MEDFFERVEVMAGLVLVYGADQQLPVKIDNNVILHLFNLGIFLLATHYLIFINRSHLLDLLLQLAFVPIEVALHLI